MSSKIKKEIDPVKDSSADDAWPLFVEFLKNKESRITQARRIVFDRVFARHDHFRADDLAAELASGPDHVSRGTVYRTLDLMTEAGFVQKIRDQDVHAHYEHIYGHGRHSHLICEKTGNFIEFSSDVIADEIERICRKHHFKQRFYRLVVFGTLEENSDSQPAEIGLSSRAGHPGANHD